MPSGTGRDDLRALLASGNPIRVLILHTSRDERQRELAILVAIVGTVHDITRTVALTLGQRLGWCRRSVVELFGYAAMHDIAMALGQALS